MHFASHPSNDGRGGSQLNVNHNDLANNLARHKRTMSFDFPCCDRAITIATFSIHKSGFVFRAIRLEANATPAETVTLKTARTIARYLFVVDVRDGAPAEFTIDREVVAGLDPIF